MEVSIANPKAFAKLKLPDLRQCKCGHNEFEHRIDKACSKCICFVLEVP